MLLDGEDVYAGGVDPVLPAPPGGHGLPAAEPLPHHVDPRQRGRRAAPQRHAAATTSEIVERMPAPGRAVGRGEGPARRSAGTSLSGGQQQRLCIARALAVEPEVLLMDEPASALDPIATAKIEELIDELKEQYTIVIVTHNMQQAARVSDNTAFFYLGELVEIGPTEQIFTNPRERRTEDYVTGKFG